MSAHLPQVGGRQVGQGQGQGCEVVEQFKLLQSERFAQRRDGEGPVVVGHLHVVALYGVGDGDGATEHGSRRPVLQREVVRDGITQRGVVGAGQGLHLCDGGASPRLEGKAGIGAAHVGEQPQWSSGVGNGEGHGTLDSVSGVIGR